MYHQSIQTYFDEDQIEPAKLPSKYILPHHAVIKDSSSHPLRIVFNASHMSSNNESLNNAMYVGPKLQRDVGDIILNFRLNAIALCADIRQMYRAVILHPDDRCYQHIFWRFHYQEPIQELELKRLTFDFGPASYLAQKCLHMLADAEYQKYPAACNSIKFDSYVDDILTGCDTVENCQQLRADLTSVLASDLLSEWQTFVKQVPCITDLKIPRYISDVNSISFEIIGFSDASSVAMAAVVYLRVQLPDGQVQVNLLRAKLKVAPTKPVTIPRLELSAADLLIKIIDTLTSFNVISNIIQRKENEPYKGPLKNLSPFLDPSGILRVGGRLKNSPLSYDSKHPMLLPAKTHLAKLVVDYFHIFALHGNPRIILSLIQRTLWIIGARNLIKKQVFSCLKCYKLSASACQPYMGDIPVSRFAQGRCFINTAIDFAGPFLLKTGTRRNSPIVKSYMVVLVCMASKAVHLELANSLTMESCLAALDRFVARRGNGKPCHTCSDQGSNFKASARHLTDVRSYLKIPNPKLNGHLSSRGILWHFHPPGAPNFSGFVEAGVKSAKYHLSRKTDGRPLYQEELTTLLCQIHRSNIELTSYWSLVNYT
ncbi:hypothetical protein M8J77_010917 [Diaphorina citri]|nr:hypothetical protein M8J77_010917 [Diaphorina citri]